MSELFPIGSRVQVRRGAWAKRFGRVIDLPSFPWRDHRCVHLDATKDAPDKVRLVDVIDLRMAKPAPGNSPAPRIGQLSLFSAEASP